MNAPPFPLNPTVGQRFGQWVWNGGRWVCSPATGVQVVTQVFTASGPYMPSPGLVSVVVETIGGGGGGGGPGQTQATEAIAAGGGGAGGYSRITLPAALVAGGVQVTIGAGGAGALQPASGQPTNGGGTGGQTSFGAFCVSNGGTGGGLGPGIGAPEGVGEIVFAGAPGQGGFFFNFSEFVGTLWTVPGGSSPYGGGPSTTYVVVPGAAISGVGVYPNSGAGGMGGASNMGPAGSGAAGGPGSSGICIVTEYCWMDVVPDDCTDTVNVNARVAVEGRGGWGGAPYVDHRGGEFGDE